jgi:hypothetical protein
MKRIRILLATLAFFAASSLQGSFAVAGHQWCEEDPEFLVNGRVVDVSMFFERSHAAKVKGSVHFDMQVPSNAVAAVVSLPGTIPVTASISRTLPPYYGLVSQIPVVVTVSMNASASFPTYTLVTGLHRTLVSTLQGTSTKPTKAKFYLTGL